MLGSSPRGVHNARRPVARQRAVTLGNREEERHANQGDQKLCRKTLEDRAGRHAAEEHADDERHGHRQDADVDGGRTAHGDGEYQRADRDPGKVHRVSGALRARLSTRTSSLISDTLSSDSTCEGFMFRGGAKACAVAELLAQLSRVNEVRRRDNAVGVLASVRRCRDRLRPCCEFWQSLSLRSQDRVRATRPSSSARGLWTTHR